MGIGVNADAILVQLGFARQRIKLCNALDLLAEELKPPSRVIIMGGKQLDRIAAHTETAALERQIIARILQLHELLHQCARVDLLPFMQVNRHRRIGLDRANAVDARH